MQTKSRAYQALLSSSEYRRQKLQADLWTAAFFWPLRSEKGNAGLLAPTEGELRRLRRGEALASALEQGVLELAEENRFFHWPLEFPEVFEQNGFSCVLGNPPWERIKLQEEEFFASRDPEIATAQNKAVRQKLIQSLVFTNQTLAVAFENAKHAAECSSKFARQSERFPLTAVGDINTYAIFAEHVRMSISQNGRAGIIVPPGIASDDTYKNFFADLMAEKNLVELTSFVNEKFIFVGVLHNFRFCTVTLAGKSWKVEEATFAYECQTFDDTKQEERRFTLSKSDLALLNPNTLTAPVFRSKIDSELCKRIYRQVPILESENLPSNPWGISFMRMFDMSNDSGLFISELKERFLPLFEAKMMNQFDHRFGSFGKIAEERAHMLPATDLTEYQDPQYTVMPCYWVPESEVLSRLSGRWSYKWLITFRGITSKALERSVIFSILPLVGVGNSAPAVIMSLSDTKLASCFLCNLNSLVLDYVARQKISGANFNFFIVKQLPVLSPETYTPDDINFIIPRVLELTYTAYDLKPFAEDMDYYGEPFRWDEERRALLRAELDAYYARLYGLNRDELRYILDPQDVYGSDFPGETFRVLKEKEIRLYGEYRTRRLVLEAWDRMFGELQKGDDL